MSTGISERDKQLLRREGFMAGMRFHFSPNEVRDQRFAKDAAEIFPLPTITRPRVVRDPHGLRWNWTVKDGVIHPKIDGLGQLETITPQRVALWADLLANPTELVEESEPPLDDMERR